MIIVDFGFFYAFEPEDERIVYYRNDEGEDWYQLRAGLTEWRPENGKFLTAVFGAWAMVDADGVVTNVEFDPSRLAPLERRILGVDCSHKEIEVGMIYRDGELQSSPREATDDLAQ